MSLWSAGELNIGLMVASAPALKPRFEAIIRKFMEVTNISSQTKRYGNKYGTTSRSINLKGDFDDTEDLKLDYYHKTIGMPTNRVNISHDSDPKTLRSDHSSEDIILQGTSDERKNDQITITKTVEIQKSRHK